MRVPVSIPLAALLVVGCAGPEAEVPPASEEGPASFDALLEVLEDAGDRQGVVDAFLEGRALPLVEGDGVVFVLRAEGALVAGDFDGWSGAQLVALEGTDVSYARVPLPEDARVDYKFIVDGEYVLDPANPRRCPSGFGDNSEVAMGGWQYPADIDFDPAIAHGTLNDVVISEVLPAAEAFTSRALGNTRDVWIYVPNGADTELPLLVVNDGGDYLHLAHMHHVLDAGIARGEIAPLAAVFVSPVDREAEYVGDDVDAYVEMVRDELLPFVEERVALVNGRGAHGVWGTSFSGFISVKLAAELAPTFGRVATQSGRVLIDGGGAIAGLADVKLWMDTGTLFDTAVENRDARDRLEASVDVEYLEVNEGHSWGSWRSRVGPGLRSLFPAQ